MPGTKTLAYYEKSVNYGRKNFYGTGPWTLQYYVFLNIIIRNLRVNLLTLFCKIHHFITVHYSPCLLKRYSLQIFMELARGLITSCTSDASELGPML